MAAEPRSAVRRALAEYLRGELGALYSAMTVFDEWPHGQALPDLAVSITVPDVAPDAPTPAVDARSPQDAFVAPDVVCGRGEVICGGGSALSPGRCVDIRTDSANCGACGQACAAPWQNSAPTCRPGGICEFNCEPGWINCDGRIENGCERALDATDCRTCGNNCPYPLTCALDGRCVTS